MTVPSLIVAVLLSFFVITNSFHTITPLNRCNTFSGFSRVTKSQILSMKFDVDADTNTVVSTSNSMLDLTKKLLVGCVIVTTLSADIAYAGIDPKQLQQYNSLQAITNEQKKKIEEVQAVLDAADVPFTDLKSGVSYREFRAGKGDRVVVPGSTVSAKMTIRCESFTTQKEPGGVKYYDTKIDTPNNELVWTIGSGELPPALEEAIIGMKRNAIRRIEVPSVLVFQARKNNQLPLPSDDNKDGQRRYKRLFKTDATLLFEVGIDKIVPPTLN